MLKIKLVVLTSLLVLSGCSFFQEESNMNTAAPQAPPDFAPPYEVKPEAESELTDENAANMENHSDDELATIGEAEPGLGSDPAALESAFYTGTEDLCAAVFSSLSGEALVGKRIVSIKWCRTLAAQLEVDLSSDDESVAHKQGWTFTKLAVFQAQPKLCSVSGRCVTSAQFEYPF